MLESMIIACPKLAPPGPSRAPSSSLTVLPALVAKGVAHTTISSPPSAAPIRGELAANGCSVSTLIGVSQ
jgi:hypothetical protein